MAAKAKAKAASGRGAYYTLEGGKQVCTRKCCPRCGPGVYLAEHSDRSACGRCGYTEFKK
ncbi:MAG: 30S ribosomal protein S27ae [Methanoregulaceae archaeon]|nr:30S ribosomal protein S27ae [Methanoregulaceae archaeon]